METDPAPMSNRTPASATRWVAWVAANALLALIYFAAGKLGLTMAHLNLSASPVWPPTGVALASVLLFGPRLWPGVWIGAFLVNVSTPISSAAAVGIACGNTLEALGAAWLTERFAAGRKAFEEVGSIWKFVLVAAPLGTAISPTVGVTCLGLAGFAAWQDVPLVWATWWLGDLVGAVTLAPLIVLWATRPDDRREERSVAELLALLALVLAVGVAVFAGTLPPGWQSAARPFMAIPPLLWAAVRFGPRGAIATVFLTSCIALWGALHGVGPFILERPNDTLLLLQVFVWTITVTQLVLAAAVMQSRRVEASLRSSRREIRDRLAEIENLYHTAPVGLCLLDTEARFMRVNDRLAALHGAPAADHEGRSLREMLPDLADTLEPLHRRVLATGEPAVEMPLVTERPDGREGTRHWLVSYSPVVSPTGEVTAVSGVVLDITERKRVEAELREWQHDLQAPSGIQTSDLALAHRALRAEARERVELETLLAEVVDREKLRIAAELHDGFGQRLTGVSLFLAELHGRLATASPERAREVHRLQEMVRECIAEAESLASSVCPIDMEVFGLRHALENLAASTGRSFGVTCVVDADGVAGADARGPAALQIYRIVQEAVHNGVRHGGAGRIEIRLASSEGSVKVTVEDDGSGLPPGHEARGGMGLRIMRHRARLVGGRLEVGGRTPHGVVVTCTVPAARWRAILTARDPGSLPTGG